MAKVLPPNFPGGKKYEQRKVAAFNEVLQEALLMLLAPGARSLRMIKKLSFAPAGQLLKLQKLEKVRKTLAPSLRRFLTGETSAERLSNLGYMKETGKKVAPAVTNVDEFYRPAVRLRGEKILWHPEAGMHSDTIKLNLKGKKSFDYSSVKGGGAIGPDGKYYEQSFGTDALTELWYEGIEDSSKTWRP